MGWIQWLDYSSRQRERVLELLATPKDKGMLDELGVGSIRDAIADHLFPPLSTIQTRPKYFLFVAWIYSSLERSNVADDNLLKTGRRQEVKLIAALKASESEDKRGLIGAQKGYAARLPSSIYWAGLRTLGIFTDRSSLAEYLNEMKDARAESRLMRANAIEATEDAGSPAATLTWDRLPRPSSDFTLAADFSLSEEEAGYLRDKTLGMRSASGRTCFLQWLLTLGPSVLGEEFKWPWDLLGTPGLASDLRQDLLHARNFSICIEGLTTHYYWLVASEMRGMDAVGRAAHDQALDDWCTRASALSAELRLWWTRIDEFWTWVKLANPRLQRDMPFVQNWLGVLAALAFEPKAEMLTQDSDLRRTIERRERQLKRELARLTNEAARVRWEPVAEGMRLGYRWATARQFVNDIRAGLDGGEFHA